ncbi:MAG: hypothetical protein NPIRA01_17360 [Nitrospirales bacterium]|nr:MAG: hypothetical protein NPIRA01_17360 [Nitrospirales bacterium]
MGEYKQLKYYFDKDLAVSLADKICPVYPDFRKREFVKDIVLAVKEQELKQRVETIADALSRQLPVDYSEAVNILTEILGPENKKETGMFTEGYWLMPVACYVEKYGTEHFDESIQFIEEITKRHTGEYAIRPFIVTYSSKTLKVMNRWSKSKHAHVRRLASEGLRPRLPWAKKISIFSDDPSPVINILENLKSDRSAYVRKSVANNLNDFLKENYPWTISVLKRWREIASEETRWIIKHALRNEVKKNNQEALKLIR